MNLRYVAAACERVANECEACGAEVPRAERSDLGADIAVLRAFVAEHLAPEGLTIAGVRPRDVLLQMRAAGVV